MSKRNFQDLLNEARKNDDYWQKWLDSYAGLNDLVDYLYNAVNDIYNECLNEFADDEEDVIERVQIRAYQAIQKVKGEKR